MEMEIKDHLSCTVNTLVSDDLAIQGAKASAVMVLISSAWIFQVQPQKG